MALLTTLSFSPLSLSSSSSPPPSLSIANHKPIPSLHSPSSASSVVLDERSHRCRRLSTRHRRRIPSAAVRPTTTIAASLRPEPLKIMISGAPASGKGTQCELIKKKYGLVHISAGDLLRAEVAAGTENGKRAKDYMEKGMLVPDEIVVMMVKERLLKPDAQENGWLLDGYPRSLSQATALEDLGIRPDLFILLDVSEDALIERVVGRRLDPVTGKIYHLKYAPPESEEIAARVTQRFDDTEEKVKLRLQTHHQNVEAVLSVYKDLICKIDGNASKEDVFAKIDGALPSILEQKSDQWQLRDHIC
ncbi:adenylate kinase, chloroplastic-like isoform X4 [Iris pallida]|uniref:adenylate kinase n=1 Tax=Iris pallida TaxID=29817 RepID=A0AAX6FS75_IRIPA|nr:adenylate kinase, chloroplastic-like isoform X4 [Iris pallida]